MVWIGLAVLAAVALVLAVSIRSGQLPPDLLRPVNGTATIVDKRGRPLASLASSEARFQEPIPLARMGQWLPAVTVALEDRRFRDHRGIDAYAVAAALARNSRAGHVVSGASTITQQLIKLASGRVRRSWRAKLYESVSALRLERMWSKDRILEEYLNRSQYGNRLVGPAAAARAYFGKTPENLALSEAIYLAGLPQAPTRFNPWRQPSAAGAKYLRSLSRLRALRFISPEQAARMSKPPRVLARSPIERVAPHFIDAILQTKPTFQGVVESTLDLDLQRFVEKRLASHLASLALRQVDHGSVVVIDTVTGAVRAMVGSRDYGAPLDGQINGAMIFRSCGSTLKPFLYLRAIEDRTITAASLLPDTPDAVRAEYIDYDPINYDKRFWGPVRVREALANSFNVPAVVTLSRVGARRMFRILEECGLDFARLFDEYGAGLILGNAEVRLLDLTAAYTAFAGTGLAVEPRLLAADPTRHHYVASPEAVAIVADILSDNHARRKTFGPFSPLAFEGKHIPCKTGTSTAFRDAWAVGVTAQHAVGVWVGNFDGRPMEEIAAITGAAPLWREIVEHLLLRGDSPVPAPVESSRLRRREVCALTGLRPVATSPGTLQEWFLPGTEPAEDASRYLRRINGEIQLLLPGESRPVV